MGADRLVVGLRECAGDLQLALLVKAAKTVNGQAFVIAHPMFIGRQWAAVHDDIQHRA